MCLRPAVLHSIVILLVSMGLSAQAQNLIDDPSFEQTKSPDQFGLVFAKWGGWKYEGDCEFAVGQLAHSGRTSCLLIGNNAPKIRIRQEPELEPGRYRVTAYLRGLDITTGTWRLTTDFLFGDSDFNLARNGTFGWTKLTYVGELKKKAKTPVAFCLLAPGYLWIDDVSVVKVADTEPLTPQPVLDKEEAPIVAPGEVGKDAIACAFCGRKNRLDWKSCYACGTPLAATAARVANGPPVKIITSFEAPYAYGLSDEKASQVVEEHATEGRKALRMGAGFLSLDARQDWSGYDFLKADFYTDSPDPVNMYVEIRDAGTTDYWTRFNYVTIIPPGASTFVLPVKSIYMGEKSRPGRALDLASVTRVVFNRGEGAKGALFIDNIRLERDEAAQKVRFEGLRAFDLGPPTGPVMDGFTQIVPGTTYAKGRGYGLKNAKIWRAFDVLQPEPLYQDFICFESGGLAVDVPNGKYHVFVNMDNPSGFWGEYQIYETRSILAQGKEVVRDTMDFDSLKKKYFRFWNVEDMPYENTFDKYQKAYYREKEFDVDVDNGQLLIEFKGQDWACSVSAIVLYPVEKAEQGQKFLKWVQDRRRFYFDNYFKRVLHRPSGDPLAPGESDRKRGFVTFTREVMKDVYYNDTPFQSEVAAPMTASAFAGEHGPMTVSIVPLQDLGTVTVTASDLTGPGGIIPASTIEVGFVSYRVTRVTGDGTVYSITPRLIMPFNATACPKDVTRRFWLTVKTPAGAKAGLYRGTVTIKPQKGSPAQVPVAFTVRNGTLDPLDVAAGPWGYHIGIPWNGAGKEKTVAWNRNMDRECLRKMREYGFTMTSALPTIAYKGFQDGKPVLDFTTADAEMNLVKEVGGFMAVSTYCSGVQGFDAYFQDEAAMKAAGFTDYSEFVKAVYTAIQKHAEAQGWLPVYYNLGDEFQGEQLLKAIKNVEAYRKAFPKGPPYFMLPNTMFGKDKGQPIHTLYKALHVATLNGHDADGVKMIHEDGNDWAYYNGASRWTYGVYMYKAMKEYDAKFFVAWYWNAASGDPYYALDCREDDYDWCNATPDGQLVPAVDLERYREGVNDFRRLLTLARLAKEKAGTPAAQAAQTFIRERMAGFKLGETDAHANYDWSAFRRQADDTIDGLRK